MSEPGASTEGRTRLPVSYLAHRLLLVVVLCAVAAAGGRALFLSTFSATGISFVSHIVEQVTAWSWGWLPW